MFTIELHQIKVNTYVIWVTRLQNKARHVARFVLYKETACVSFRESVATGNLFVALRYIDFSPYGRRPSVRYAQMCC